jgi:hypothetical protein
MKPRLRKFTLTIHVTASVGWLGAVAAYLAPAVAGVASEDAQMLRAAYVAMDLIARFVITPLSLAALITGLLQSLGTEWGLFRYYWIVVKFVLTIAAVVILLLHIPTVSRVSEVTLLVPTRARCGSKFWSTLWAGFWFCSQRPYCRYTDHGAGSDEQVGQPCGLDQRRIRSVQRERSPFKTFQWFHELAQGPGALIGR